jgi:hypothetical protein
VAGEDEICPSGPFLNIWQEKQGLKGRILSLYLLELYRKKGEKREKIKER